MNDQTSEQMSDPMTGQKTIPPGKIPTTITYLEMLARPAGDPPPAPGESVQILHVPRPTVAFYRFLYNTVGESWLWGNRRRLSDDSLAAILDDSRVDIYVLHVDNQPAGYAELDARADGEVELAYFGLMPEFIGRGLGPYLLGFAIHAAWDKGPDRLWVHTCTLDHPAALGTYRKWGFVPYKTEQVLDDDPRALGLIPEQVAPHIPLIR